MILRMLALFAFPGGMLPVMASVPSASAESGTASLTIHSRFCPPGYDGTDSYTDCHGTAGMRGVQCSAYTENPDTRVRRHSG